MGSLCYNHLPLVSIVILAERNREREEERSQSTYQLLNKFFSTLFHLLLRNHLATQCHYCQPIRASEERRATEASQVRVGR